MAATKTDTRILGTYWMLNDDDAALESAIKQIRFELDTRAARRGVTEQAARVAAGRLAEVQEDIRRITNPDSVYGHQAEGI